MTPSSAVRFCPSCGQALPGPVQACPRCRASIAAALGVPRKSNTPTIVVIVIAAIFGAIPILAAIAIPNFIRYQLRSKQSQVTAELQGLARAQHALAQRTGKYVAIAAIPAVEPGEQKSALTADELAAAASIDWMVAGSTYGQYRVAVSEDGTAAALCGESNVDGDAQRAAFAVFLPGDGVEPPPAPCAEPVAWSSEYAPGEVLRVTDPSVF
ncbi:MAG TPA: zinc ribbon domain-containing protein [Anaeromyxobacter sp.]|nr:zinc ribbon domain-containing protein [Anaeromyxobacter sp.]